MGVFDTLYDYAGYIPIVIAIITVLIIIILYFTSSGSVGMISTGVIGGVAALAAAGYLYWLRLNPISLAVGVAENIIAQPAQPYQPGNPQ